MRVLQLKMRVPFKIRPLIYPSVRFVSHKPTLLNGVEEKFPQENINGRPQFQHAKIGSFFQDPPVLKNPYLSDSLLVSYLRRNVERKYLPDIEEDLARFGKRICQSIDEHGHKCDISPPTLTHYDPWGKRIDRINTCESWKFMKVVSAEEGLIATGYERNHGSSSRLYQMAKLYLINPSSGLYSCPLAMTDGAAKILETLSNDISSDDGLLGNAYRRITSRNPDLFWTSGQWMTEKRGGSDVGNATETVAYAQADGSYRLHGYKWFTSATDADVVFLLARIADEIGDVVPGSRGLSLFFLETKGESDNGLNGLQVQRLKDKLGTRQVPTAEMLLDGAVAHQVGDQSHGVRFIAHMLTLSRIHNSISASSSMRRLLQLAVDYSHRRTAFGAKLSNLPLHVQTLARMDVESRGAFLLTFEIVRLLGLEEIGQGSREDSSMLRLLTPVCKLYTAKQALKVTSEGLESFGGAGFLEDTGLPRYLRDAQVLSIWEGTTNVLSHDVLRAMEKSSGEILTHFFASVNARVRSVRESGKGELMSSCDRVDVALKQFMEVVEKASSSGKDFLVLSARDLSYSIARIYIAALFLDHASWNGASSADVYAAQRWCQKSLCLVHTMYKDGCYDETARSLDEKLVYESRSD